MGDDTSAGPNPRSEGSVPPSSAGWGREGGGVQGTDFAERGVVARLGEKRTLEGHELVAEGGEEG